MFANSYGGRFPRAFQMRNSGPLLCYGLSNDADRDADDPQSWSDGTPWKDFLDTGLDPNMALCPSNEFTPWTWYNQWWWHARRIGYFYVGGLGDGPVRNSTLNWRDVPPAISASEDHLGEHVLASDTVYWGGGTHLAHGDGREINHPSPEDPRHPDFQNILFGDGHVEAKGASYYSQPLNIHDNFSARHGRDPYGGFFYWNGS